MKQLNDPDHQSTLRVRLSHPDVGNIGEGSITFGYSCLAHLVLDRDISLSDAQLAQGLLAHAEDGTRLSLFNCECKDRTLFPEFVIRGEVKAPQFFSFEVRYSDVSEWFFQQMYVEGQLGEQIKWRAAPSALIANVALPDANFRIESFYVGSLENSGEDRTLHQHFEFRFTATKSHFSPAEIKHLVRRFADLLSILLAHQCPIVSVDVSQNGDIYGRMYFGVYKSPPIGARPQDDSDRVTWRKFFALKSDVDGCWEDVVSAYFRSEYREVIWSRLAGMQNHEGFWEHRVLGYVTLLDSYVSQRFGKSVTPKLPPTDNLVKLKAALADVQPTLNSTQQAAVLDAASQIFSTSATFASKFQALLDSLDPDVLKIVSLTQDNFKLVKKLRNEVAHGQQPTFTGPDITPVFEITNRIILLLTHLFFLDVGLGRDVFLRCLSRPHTELRMISKLDEVHLDRTLHSEQFFQVSSQELTTIRLRPRELYHFCFERNPAGAVTYSERLSSELFNATRSSRTGQFHEFLGLPKDAVNYLSKAYFEDGAQTELVYSTVIVDLAINAQ